MNTTHTKDIRYTFPFPLKAIAIVLILVGTLLFGVGYYQSSQIAHEIHEKGMQAEAIQHQMTAREARIKEMEVNGERAPIILEKHDSQTAEKHLHHIITQVSNRPWTAFYIAAFMTLGIALATLFFLAVQHASSAGWPIILVRVMEGIASYLPIGGIIIFAFFLFSSIGHGNHIFHWMDQSLLHKYMIPGEKPQYIDEMLKGAIANPDYDAILAGKSAFLNIGFWLTRAAIFIGAWILFYFLLTRASKRLDENPNNRSLWFKQRNLAAAFLVVFAVSSSIISWDWIMSIDPHWFSTLFGWYTFSSYLVSAIAVIILVSVFLKSQGVFPQFNDNHLHDLTKFLFGFSLLWAYLWFSQFMLIWYANIPEEVTYFYARWDEHRWRFWIMLVPNLLLPFLVLVSSKVKRKPKIVVTMAFVILIGHFLDFFNLMMPGSVGAFSGIGFAEIGAMFFFIGLFIFVIFTMLTKRKAQNTGNPMYHESEIYHYPF